MDDGSYSFIKEYVDINADDQYIILCKTSSSNILIEMDCDYGEHENFDYKTETMWDKIKKCCCLSFLR